DSFAQPSLLWEGLQDSWNVADNAMVQSDPSGMRYLRVKDNPSWSDVYVEANIKFNSFYKKAGIIFRADESYGTYYRAELSNNALKLQKYRGGVKIKEDTFSLGFELTKDAWYKIAILAEEDHFEVMLDGVSKISIYDTDNPILAGGVTLFTEGCQASFDDTIVQGETQLDFIHDKKLLTTDLDGTDGVTSRDYDILKAIINLAGEDKERMASLSKVEALKETIGGSVETILIDNYDLSDDNIFNATDINLVRDMAAFADQVQRQTVEYVTKLDFDASGTVGVEDKAWILNIVESYQQLDMNGDGIVNDSDFQRIESLARAQLLLQEATRDLDGSLNPAREAQLLQRADINKNGRIDQEDVETLGMVISIYGAADINKDTQVNSRDLVKLNSIITMLYDVGKISPSEIIKMDLVGEYDSRTKTYAPRDGKIDSSDMKRALELLGTLYESGTDYGMVWGDLDQLFRVGIDRMEFDDADLDGDGFVDANDITIFINNAGRYLETDMNGDGYVDRNDLDVIIETIKRIYSRIAFTAELLAASDLNGDEEVDSKDTAIANMFININGANGYTEEDVQAVRDVAYAARVRSLDGNTGSITQADIDVVADYSTRGVTSVIKDGYQAYNLEGADVKTAGLTVVAKMDSAVLTYDCNLAKAGKYYVGLNVRNYDTTAFAKPYRFNVFVDGQLKGEFSVDPNMAYFERGSLELDLAAGMHFVRFVALYDAEDKDRKFQVEEAFVDSIADFNRDGIVDQEDVTIVTTIKNRSDAVSLILPGQYTTDVNGDGVTDHRDTALVEEAYSIMLKQTTPGTYDHDTNNDGIMNETDVSNIDTTAEGQDPFIESAGDADLNGDGRIDPQDIALLKSGLYELFYQQNVSREEKAVSDINGDGIIDFSDIKLLAEVNSFYASSDINADGVVDRSDIESLQGIFDSIYSDEVLSVDIGGFGGTISLADLTANGTTWSKDGKIDAKDVEILQEAISNAIDIDGNGTFDNGDRNWLIRMLTFRLAIEYEDVSQIRSAPGVLDSALDVQLKTLDLNGDGTLDAYDTALVDEWFNRIVMLRDRDLDILPAVSKTWPEILNAIKILKPVSIDYEGAPQAIAKDTFAYGEGDVLRDLDWEKLGGWQISGGVMRQEWSADIIQTALLDKTLEDGVVTFNMKLTGSEGKKAGALLRVQDDGDCYMVSVDKIGVGQARVRLEKKIVTGTGLDEVITYTELASSDIGLAANNDANFDIRIIEGTIKVRINNENVIDYNDRDPLLGGKIGLFTGKKTEAMFDDFKAERYLYKPGLAMSESVEPVWATDGGTWEFYRGQMIQNDASSSEAYKTLQGAELADFEVHADIKLTGTYTTIDDQVTPPQGGVELPNNTAGVILRSDADRKNYLEVRLKPADGRIYLTKVETITNGDPDPIHWQKVETVLAYDEMPIMRDQFYNLDVKVIGDHIEVFVNGKKILNAIDGTYQYGDKGILELFTGSSSTAAFKNIAISKITPFDSLTQDTKGVELTLIQKLDTLSQTRNIDGTLRVNGTDRLLFSLLSEGMADLTGAGDVPDGKYDFDDLRKLSIASNYCVRNPGTNNFAGDVNRDGAVNAGDVDIVTRLVTLTDDANAEGYIKEALGLNSADALLRLNALAAKDSSGDYTTALGDSAFTFKDFEFLLRYADLTRDGVVNFKDRDRLVKSDTLYNFLAINKEGMEMVRFDTSFKDLDLADFAIWDPADRSAFVASILSYVTEMKDTNPVLRDFNKDGTFTTIATAGNTTVSGLINVVTHADGTQTKVVFNPSTGNIAGAWYIESDRRPVVIHNVEFRDKTMEADGSYTLHTMIVDGGYMNINVKDGAVKEVYMMKTDFKDKYISDSYRSGALSVTVDGIIQALQDRRDLNGDGVFSIDRLSNKPSDLELMNGIFDITHMATTPQETERMDIDENGIFENADIELYHDLVGYMVDLNNDTKVDMWDLLAMKKQVGVYSTGFDLDKDGDVDMADYALLDDAIGTVKDINGDEQFDDLDVQKMESIFRYERERELIEFADLNGDNEIDATDIDILQKVRSIDVNGDEIVRAFTSAEGAPQDWSKLAELKEALDESHNKDWLITGLMADMEMTLELFEAIDKNQDGVFDLLDLPEGLDPFHFHDYDVNRSDADKGVLGYYDEYLVQKAIDNLLFVNKLNDASVAKADVNKDGVINFDDYEVLSRAYEIVSPDSGDISRDIDLSGGSLPDTADLAALRHLAVLLKEGDVNGDGFRTAEDEALIKAAIGSYNMRNGNSVLNGTSVTKRADNSLVTEYVDNGDYRMGYNMTVSQRGYYYVGLSARATSAISVPESGLYKFRVKINGVTVLNADGSENLIEIRGSTSQYNDSSIKIYRDAPGTFNVEFEWVNAAEKKVDLDRDGVLYEQTYENGMTHLDAYEIIATSLEVKDAYINTEKYDSQLDLTQDGKIDSTDVDEFKQAITAYAQYRRCDVNGDGRVDEKDKAAYENGSEISSTLWNQVLKIGDTLYNVRYNKDTDTYTINGKSNELGSNIIEVAGKKYIILNDLNGEIRLVEKLAGDVIGAQAGQGPDGNIDIWDWGYMASRAVNPPIRKVGANYVETETTGAITRSGNSMVKDSGGVGEAVYSFDIREICDSGYEVGFDLRSLGSYTNLPAGYQHEIDIFVDGRAVKAGTITLMPSAGYTTVYLKIDKDAFGEGENIIGRHFVKVAIGTTDKIEVKEAFLRIADRRGDINNDGFADAQDYDVFRRQFATDRNVRTIILSGYTTESYAMRNENGTYTVLVVDPSTGAITRSDSDRDGKLITIGTTDYCIYVPEFSTDIYIAELKASDVNRDGTVSWKDGILFERIFTDQSTPINASEASSFGDKWTRQGDAMLASDINSRIGYQVSITETGKYDVGLDIMNALGSSGGNYEIAVYLDGERLVQTISVERNGMDYKYGYAGIYMLEGTHTVEFEWTNAMEDTNLLLGDVRIFDTRLDLVVDGKADSLDVNAFRAERMSTADLERIQFAGSTYYVRGNYDGTFTLFDQNYGVVSSSGADGVVATATQDKLMIERDETGKIIFSELLSQDVDNDGIVDVKDLELIVEECGNANLSIGAGEFTGKWGSGFRYSASGIRMTGTANGDYLEYTVDVSKDGYFDVGLEIAAFAAAGYIANLTVTIDDTKSKDIRIASGDTSESAIFDITKGTHKVKIVWNNRTLPDHPSEITLKAISMVDRQTNLAADITRDGVVDGRDIDMWYDLAPATVNVYSVGSYYALRKNDGTFIFYTSSGTPYISSADGKYALIESVPYIIGYDAGTDAIML
ncbi:MAG: dockerin type I domain-containing protein, partial [Candidatus Omnitrophota bacterium]